MKKSSLLIASSNQGKLLEIRAIVEQSQLILPFDLITPQELGLTLEVPETGSTYQENAAIKAVTYARHFGMITMADDSGLEVELLGGEPGVRSARYSPIPDATDADRRTYLLQRLVGHPQPWQARFYCLVAIATPDETGNL
jgi:XTP/dITP diphosphohydrolase